MQKERALAVGERLLRRAARCTLAAGVSATLMCAPAYAQSSGAKSSSTTSKSASKSELKVSSKKPTSPNVVINLINLMVEQKLITADKADALIKQAEDEAYVSRQATKDAAVKAAAAAKEADAASAAVSPPGTKHIVYVPEIVKRQIREDLKKEVLREAKDERWAAPGTFPEWAERIHFSGDFRLRSENIFYPKGNAPSGFFPNFNVINTGTPYDTTLINTGINPPYLNSTQDRDRFRIQARLGAEAYLFDGFTSGIRFATGSDSQPVSTNQTLTGNFSKYQIWLDRAYLNYTALNGTINATGGRFANPFFSATDLVWYHDLGFDGAAVQVKHEIGTTGVTPFVVAGAFPTFNTDLNFGTTSAVKYGSEDRYLLGGQIGTAWAINPKVNSIFSVAYYDFTNIQGRLSDPCTLVVQTDTCDTDDLRPPFAQNGNTYMALRNIVPTTINSNGAIDQWQYFGLASAFRELDVSGRVDLGYFYPVNIIVDGEFVDNTAFNKAAIAAVAFNNFGGTPNGIGTGPYVGGNIGWMGRLTIGHEELQRFGDWNFNIGYKYLQSDAVVDAFADSDFGLGGTNLKGYLVGGNFALNSNVWTTLRWMSANSIAGPPYNV